MNNYITLDGYKYATNANKWEEVTFKPATVRYTLSGNLDVTYGDAAPREWLGEILAPVTARGEGWGTITTLKATLVKKSAVTFVDHYDYSCDVHCVGEQRGRSLMPRWDDPQNVFFMPVRLVEEV